MPLNKETKPNLRQKNTLSEQHPEDNYKKYTFLSLVKLRSEMYQISENLNMIS